MMNTNRIIDRMPSARRRSGTIAILVAMVAISLLLVVLPAVGQEYDLSWFTIDGGGAPSTAPEGYELLGTVAQADADATELTGDGYSLVGGFWPAVAPFCTCMADVNNDDRIDGADIQRFLDCALADDGECECADLDRSGGVAPADLSFFVEALLTDSICH